MNCKKRHKITHCSPFLQQILGNLIYLCTTFLFIYKLWRTNKRMKHSIKYWAFKLKYLVALAIFVVAIGFVGENCLVNRIGQQQEIAKLKGEIDEYNRKFEKDKATLDALKHDPDAMKEVARSRYYMKTDNEDIFIIEEEDE